MEDEFLSRRQYMIILCAKNLEKSLSLLFHLLDSSIIF